MNLGKLRTQYLNHSVWGVRCESVAILHQQEQYQIVTECSHQLRGGDSVMNCCRVSQALY